MKYIFAILLVFSHIHILLIAAVVALWHWNIEIIENTWSSMFESASNALNIE